MSSLFSQSPLHSGRFFTLFPITKEVFLRTKNWNPGSLSDIFFLLFIPSQFTYRNILMMLLFHVVLYSVSEFTQSDFDVKKRLLICHKTRWRNFWMMYEVLTFHVVKSPEIFLCKKRRWDMCEKKHLGCR